MLDTAYSITFGTRYRPSCDGRRRALESFAVDRFGHRVVTQTQRDVFDLLDRMGKRRDAGGIDRLHLLDEAEEIVELGKRVLSFGVSQFEPREVRDAFYIGQGQSHAVTGKFGGPPQRGKNDAATAGYDTGGRPEKAASGGKKCRPFPSNTSKIIRYHYAFDPNPDRLTKAFLNNF